MRIITQSTVGGPEVLHVAQAPVPEPRPGEVLIKIEAIGLNPVDAAVRSGAFPLLGDPPFVLGWDVAGTVEAAAVPVGESAQASPFQVGDQVFGLVRFPAAGNTYAEYVNAVTGELAPIPEQIDPVHAAALPLAGLTAWQALVDAARVSSGQRVLVHGAGGGVGHLAVQIAVALGAEVVATASAAKAGPVKQMGASTVIDYRSGDLAGLLREQAGRVNAVLDAVGGDAAEASLEVLVPGGVLVTLTRGHDAALRELVENSGRRFEAVSVRPSGNDLAELSALVSAGTLHVQVEQIFGFDDVVRAHQLLDASSGRGTGRGIAGKLVLAP